jgi:hypothetical protein
VEGQSGAPGSPDLHMAGQLYGVMACCSPTTSVKPPAECVSFICNSARCTALSESSYLETSTGAAAMCVRAQRG